MSSPEQPRFLQRRVATAPTLLQPFPKVPVNNTREQADTIFNHANAKVVSLVALSSQTFSFNSTSRDTIGPWQSHFERTIAIGTLRLYRAPGSVAFLSCGSALQPIFPKSQCWCMKEDGSKFILQIRPPSYWRIELAGADASDEEGKNTLRSCLASVLLLDKTPCPFKESVPISLPPEPLSVRKRRPWKPLRSYPSEPILVGESEDIFGAAHQNLSNDAWIEEFPIEHPVENKPVDKKTLIMKELQFHEDANNLVTESPEQHIIEDTNSKASLEAETSWTASNLQNTPHTDDRSSCIESAIVDNHSTGGQMDTRLSEQSQNTEMINIALQPYPNSRSLGPPATMAIETLLDEKRAMRRRHTIASSWLEDNVKQPPTMLQECPTIGKSTEDVARHKQTKPTTTNHSEQLSTFTFSTFKGSHHRPAQSQHEPELRLRRQGLRAGSSNLDNTPQSSLTAAGPELELMHADMLSKTILLLFYAIWGIVIVAWKGVSKAVGGGWTVAVHAQEAAGTCDNSAVPDDACNSNVSTSKV